MPPTVTMISSCEVCTVHREGIWTGGARYKGVFVCMKCIERFATLMGAITQVLDERYKRHEEVD